MKYLFSSIRVRIAVAMLIVVLGGILAFELFDHQREQNESLLTLNEVAEQKINRLAESLELPLWEVDEQWTVNIIDNEIADKTVFAIIVNSEGDLFAGKKRDDDWRAIDALNGITGDYISVSRDIVHDSEAIGEVKLYLTKHFLEEELYDQAVTEFSAALLIGLVLVLLLLLLLNRLIIRPIEQMFKTTSAIASGDYSHAVLTIRNDEIGMLGQSINSMKEDIQSREVERDSALESVRKSEMRFRSLVENAADGIFIAGIDGRYIDVNSVGCRMLGFERDEIVGKTIMDLIPPEDVARLSDSKEVMLEGETHLSEWKLLRKDGSYLPVEVSANILPDGQWQGFVRDVSERKHAEEKIKRYSQAMEQSGEAIVITNAQGMIEHVNPAFTNITGYSEKESIGVKTSLLRSGSQGHSFYEKMWDTIVYGQTWQGKVINRKKSGDLYPAMLTISPIKNDEGKTTHYIGIQQNLEKFEELEAQFHQSQKMEAIGTLVGGIAHDFNNNLAGITGNLYLAKKAAKGLPDVVHRLESVEKLSFGAAATIQQLLTFSRKGIVQMHSLSISSFLKETIKLNQVSLPENIDFQLQISDADMEVKGDINQLQQVLMNLINNAFDAVKNSENPVILIRLDHFQADGVSSDKHERLKEGGYASISVIDNGSGIKAEHIEHIFEPFFTTKEPGRGTGLGLAMVYGAIKTHGGAVEVESSQDNNSGTTVRIYLPLIEPSRDMIDEQGQDEVIDGSGETILLVDDNETVLETGRDLLNGLGYKVLTAEDGLDAIEIYQVHQNEIDLVILDIVMPRLGGVEALKAIRDINPDVKAMYATGYDKHSTLGTKKSAIAEEIISKPFAISKLSQLIRKVIEA